MSGREVVTPFAAFHTEAVPKLRATALLGRAVEGCHATVFFARGPKAKLPKLVQPPKATRHRQAFGQQERRFAKFCPRRVAFGGCTSFGNLAFGPRAKKTVA